VYISSPSGQQVPLSALASTTQETAPLTVGHQGLFPAVTISFNLATNASLGDAVDQIGSAARAIGLPKTIQTFFAGTAQAYQDSLSNEPILVASALITVYLVLESYMKASFTRSRLFRPFLPRASERCWRSL